MTSRTYINLKHLLNIKERKESIKLGVFLEVLNRCFTMIEKRAAEGKEWMVYHVPSFLTGKPIYDANELKHYLITKLLENGLGVWDNGPRSLTISWREQDINMNQYLKKESQTIQDYMEPNIEQSIDPVMTNMQARKERYEIQSKRFPVDNSLKRWFSKAT
jgi:hypothetical protein